MTTAIRRYEGDRIPYTPNSAVSAGDVVVTNDRIGVAEVDIAASTLGWLAVEGIFEMPKATGGGTDLALGQTVAWDVGNTRVTGTLTAGRIFGTVAQAAATTDATVLVALNHDGPGPQATVIAALTDSSGGATGNDTIAAIPDPTDTPASADALRDDLVATVLPKVRDGIADLAAKVNAILTALKGKGIIANS